MHGHNAEIHDLLTQSKGSFEQTIEAIKNIVELGQEVITNTVVVKQNYKHLPEIAQLLVDLKVSQFQFAFLHVIGGGDENFEKIAVSFTEAVPYIKKGLQVGLDRHE